MQKSASQVRFKNNISNLSEKQHTLAGLGKAADSGQLPVYNQNSPKSPIHMTPPDLQDTQVSMY